MKVDRGSACKWLMLMLMLMLLSLPLVYILLDHELSLYSLWPRLMTSDMTANTSKIRNISSSNTTTKPLKIILFWTPAYSKWNYSFGFGHAPFQHCPVSNCMTTRDREVVKQASAVVFHMRSLDTDTVFPPTRLPNQSYIFYLKESPWQQFNDLSRFAGWFNLTMTHRRDSDIPMTYGAVTKGCSTMDDDERVTALIRGKKKLVAWFVSHCLTKSKREDYVWELQKHVPVDIYGKCGPLNCPKEKGLFDCYDMLEQDYKFYLSFENSVCKDYVTEKTFNVLNRFVVPVVFGGANYSALTPSHSVIDVQDFASPKHLAEYLLKLNDDEVMYRKYFDWKKQYGVSNVEEERIKAFCHLCEILNRPSSSSASSHHVYENLTLWWDTDAECNSNLIDKLLHR